MSFLHGVEVIEDNSGVRPIRTVSTSVIGIVGTAPSADENEFPLNEPVWLKPSVKQLAKLGTDGTLYSALSMVFKQAGANCVVIRVAESADAAQQAANVIGLVNAEGNRTGLQALLDAEVKTTLKPKILLAPGFSDDQAVATEIAAIAEKLKAFAYVDAPNTSDEAAITYRSNFNARRVMVVYPKVKYFNTITATEDELAASVVYAGIRAKLDSKPYGFKYSVSNQVIQGITGLSKAIQFEWGDTTCLANVLNASEVSTITRVGGGFRTWGNRTTSSDSKFAFESRVRIDDAIQESLLRAHLWAVDRNITKTYFEDVIASVQAYLDQLKGPAAQVLVDAKIWVDSDDNQPVSLEAGHATFRYDFVDSPIAERITFIRRINSEYLRQLVA